MKNLKNIRLDLNNDKQYIGEKSQNYINELLNIETLDNLSKYDELSRGVGSIATNKTIKSTFLDEYILSKGLASELEKSYDSETLKAIFSDMGILNSNLSSYDELSRSLGSIIDDK